LKLLFKALLNIEHKQVQTLVTCLQLVILKSIKNCLMLDATEKCQE